MKRLNDATPEEWDAAAHASGWGVDVEHVDDTNYFTDYEKKIMTEKILELPYWKDRIKNEAINNLNNKSVSDGSTASYYQLPDDAKQLQDLISYKNLNAQIGEIFRECYRYGQASHSDEMRGIKKILFYANAELARLEKYSKK